MIVKTITYNMGMGVDDRKPPLMQSKQAAFDVFADQFSTEYSRDPGGAWFICVQEILRDHIGKNQVEDMQVKLRDKTNVFWWKHSNTHSSDEDEAVAVFSTKDLTKVQRWDLPGSRVALAVKSEIASGKNIWVVTTHLIKGSSDPDGTKRKDSIVDILKNLATFDANAPIVLCGDMNVVDPAAGTHKPEEVDPGIFNQTIGKVQRFGFTRGQGFTPTSDDITVHAWSDPPDGGGTWSIIDYVQVNEAGRCTAGSPEIINYKKGDEYASDHKGILMKIDYP